VRTGSAGAGVTFADSLMVGGTYQVKPAFIHQGLEAAGELSRPASAVDGLRAGQRALAVLRNGGGYAEEIVLDAAAWCRSPMRWILSRRSLSVAYGTSHFARPIAAICKPGETLLVLGAAAGSALAGVWENWRSPAGRTHTQLRVRHHGAETNCARAA